MPTDTFTNRDYWKAIVLYGLNNATYKIALAKTLLELAKGGSTHVGQNVLSEEFLRQYKDRLNQETAMPQQKHKERRTVMEQIVMRINNGSLTMTKAVEETGVLMHKDVIHRFHTLKDRNLAKEKFYEFNQSQQIIIKDSVFQVLEVRPEELFDEIDARWGLLEGAFEINREQFVLQNDIRNIYLQKGYQRKDITKNIPFLNGYQNNICFYCSEQMDLDETHVDHVLPRQVINHDEIWNLVLSHRFCNLQKSDHLVGPQYIEKLIARNENIMGSNHPWIKKINEQLGKSAIARRRKLENEYDKVRIVLGRNYWRGTERYSAESDPFYRSLITKMNNG